MTPTAELLPRRACLLTPAQAAAVLRAAGDGTLDQTGFPADQVVEVEQILAPVLQVDMAGNLAVPLDVLTFAGSLLDAVEGCRTDRV